MKKNFFKFFNLFFVSVLPTSFLFACSSNQISQFGINVPIESNYNFNNKKYDKTFGNFNFNNTSLSSSSQLTDSDDFSSSTWKSFFHPNLQFINNLVFVSTFQPNFQNVFENNSIFKNTEASLLKEFILASSNILNSGRRNQLKFGVTRVKTFLKFKDKNSNNSEKFFPTINDKLSVLTKEDENKKIAYYTPNAEINIAVQYGYWRSQTNNPTQSVVNIDSVKEYVNNNNSWNKIIEPKNSFFWVSLNYDLKVKIAYSNLVNSFYEVKENKSNKPIKSEILINEKDLNSIIPKIETTSYLPIQSNGDISVLNFENISNLNLIINKSKNSFNSSTDSNSINKMKKQEFKNSLTLSINEPFQN